MCGERIRLFSAPLASIILNTINLQTILYKSGKGVRTMKPSAFLLCFCLLSPVRAQSPTTTIADVKRICFPIEPPAGQEKSAFWSNPDNVDFQNLLFRSLVEWKKLPQDDPRRKLPKNDPRRTEWTLEGDCVQGYTSIIPGVRLFCIRSDADAVLLGNVGGSSHDVTSTTQSPTPDLSGPTYTTSQVHQFSGTAALFDKSTSEAIWVISKDARSGASRLFMPNVPESPSGLATRIAGQLKKDIEAARKAAGANGSMKIPKGATLAEPNRP